MNVSKGWSVTPITIDDGPPRYKKMACDSECRRHLHREADFCKKKAGHLAKSIRTPYVLAIRESSDCLSIEYSCIPGNPLSIAHRAFSDLELVNILIDLLSSLWRAKSGDVEEWGPNDDLWLLSRAAKNVKIDGITGSIRELSASTPDWQRQHVHLSHGDLCLPNILIDSFGNLGLVDWGGVARSDYHRDLGCLWYSLSRNRRLGVWYGIAERLGEDLCRTRFDWYRSLAGSFANLKAMGATDG